MVDGQSDCFIMSTPAGDLEDLWAECSGYRTPPSSGLLSVVLPADEGSAGEVFTQSDTSFCELLHSADADVLTSKGFAVFEEGNGVICPAIDIGDTFLTGCWSLC